MMHTIQKVSISFVIAMLVFASFGVGSTSAKIPVKRDPFLGLSHVQQVGSSSVYLAIENQPAPNKPFNGPHITRVDINPNGTFTRQWLFTGLPEQEYVSLAFSGSILFVTTMEGQVVFINSTNGDSVTYNGLTAGIKYGIVLNDPSLSEIGVYNNADPQRIVHYLNLSAGRYMRHEASPEFTSVVTPRGVEFVRAEGPQSVSSACSTIMALGLLRVWEVQLRSVTASTHRYLVVDSGNSFPLLPPRLLQVSYDFTTQASSVIVIATGPVGENWFGGFYHSSSGNFYVANRVGQIRKIVVNTGVISTLTSTAVDSLFFSDSIIRVESGTPQLYSVDYNGHFRKTNTNTGVTTNLAQLPGSAHSIALDSGGNSFVITGSLYESGFKAVVWKVTTSGVATVFAKGPAWGTFSFYGLTVRAANDYDVINNSIGGVNRVNSLAGPWSVTCDHSGGQNQEMIRDGSRTILGDFSQGSIQFY